MLHTQGCYLPGMVLVVRTAEGASHLRQRPDGRVNERANHRTYGRSDRASTSGANRDTYSAARARRATGCRRRAGVTTRATSAEAGSQDTGYSAVGFALRVKLDDERDIELQWIAFTA